MMGLQSWMKKELPFAVMVMLEFGDVCTTTLTKAAMNTRMNSLVFVIYHNALGTLILLPLFIFHRHRTQQPPLSFSLLCRFSLLGLLGTCLLQICLFTGINYSSPTLAAATMEDRGWKPILRKHGGKGGRNSDLGNEIHTIFVDNLPESMDPKGLYNIFINYGIVKDVFIPNKRRKLTRSRFGFVRYACPVAANMAVRKAHGIWCNNRALKVNIADFVQGKEDNQKSVTTSVGRRAIAITSRVPTMVQRGKSYAQVLSGPGLVSNPNITIQAYEEGNGWLYDSVIVRLKTQILAVEFKEELKNRGMGNVYVRHGGGRDVVLTFESADTMKEKLKSMEGWIQFWGESVKVWQQGTILDQERSVWFTCYGVPLNLWSSKTFSSIGRAWGKVIGIDESTSRMTSFHSGRVRIATKCMESINTTIILRCKGIDFPVKVCEEQVVISEVIHKQCKCYSEQPQTENSNSNGEEQDQEQRSVVGSKKGEDEADVEGHVGGVLDNTGAVEATGPRVGYDDLPDTDGHLRS